MTSQTSDRPLILLVDDEVSNLQLLRQVLQNEYRLVFAKEGTRALELIQHERPDLILLDVMMPGMDGYEVCRRLKSDPELANIPVIFVTALIDTIDEVSGFDAGAVDYITKPVSPLIVKARVRTHLSLVQVKELRDTRLQIVQRLGMAAEFKDNETGLHVIRMSHYAKTLALAAGYSASAADDLLNAAPMHDVGKIGIPDAILQKPGKLTQDEWEIMRQHTEMGAKIIGDHPTGLLHLAQIIARSHHEKWNGSGYPNGLAGESIPHAARIVAVADVFDALTSVRPYKRAWSIEDALGLIREESSQHFDPELVEIFMGCQPDILQIRERWADDIARD